MHIASQTGGILLMNLHQGQSSAADIDIDSITSIA